MYAVYMYAGYTCRSLYLVPIVSHKPTHPICPYTAIRRHTLFHPPRFVWALGVHRSIDKRLRPHAPARPEQCHERRPLVIGNWNLGMELPFFDREKLFQRSIKGEMQAISEGGGGGGQGGRVVFGHCDSGVRDFFVDMFGLG